MTDYMPYRFTLRDKLNPIKPLSNLRRLRYEVINNAATHPPNQQDEVDNRDSIRPDYRFESSRLQSYTNWPVPFMDPAKMAAAGFYYTGQDDNVKCFECGVVICQWVEGDNPMSDHQRWQSNCRFVREIPCGNVPIGADPNTIPLPSPRGRDVCGQRYGEEIRSDSSPDFRAGHTSLQLPSSAKLGSLGLAMQKPPVHSEYASYEARLRTFDTWPISSPHTKEQLADAGFFYTGAGDRTLCYHCGGGLKDWQPEDDPWIQHAKWFKKCYYVLMVKGQSFISTVTGQPLTTPTREETMQMNLPSYIKKVEPTSQDQTEVKPQQNLVVNKSPMNKSSDDARMCKICYSEELGVVFIPCGHMVACTKCAPGLTTCAVCREPVTMTVRAIIS